MIIEIIGLSGAGKTRLSIELSEKYSIPLMNVAPRFSKIFYAFCFFVVHPIVTFQLIRIVIRRNRGIRKDLLQHKLRFLLVNALAKEGALIVKKAGVIDEGLFQFSLSLDEVEVSSADVKEYIDVLKPLLKREIYLVKASVSIRKKRMKNRGRIPRSAFGKTYANDRNRIVETNVRIIESVLGEKISRVIQT